MWVGQLFGIVIPDSIHHLASKSSTSGFWLPSSCLRMSDCKAWVPTADARKAGIASDDTLRIPRPPIAMGRVDCIHCVSVRLIFKCPLGPCGVFGRKRRGWGGPSEPPEDPNG